MARLKDIALEDADVFKEESVEEGSTSFMFLVDLPHGLTAVFDGSGVFLNAHYDDHIDHDDEGGHHVMTRRQGRLRALGT